MGVFDAIGHVAEDVFQTAEHAVEGLAAAGGDLFEGGRVLAGIAVAGGALFVLGPGVTIPAFLAGAAGAHILIRQRTLTPEEREFVEAVIGPNNLPPNEKIILTNLTGLQGRSFVATNGIGQVLVNLGDGYSAPMTYVNKNYRTPGKLFIHEMTHVMQYHRATFKVGLLCEGAIGQILADGYNPGERGLDWEHYNIEQQATIVDEWFAPQRIKPATLPRHAKAHPFWRYIRDDVRRVPRSPHQAYGFKFQLPHDLPETGNAQSHWRYCKKCRAMFFEAAPPTDAACPESGVHVADGFVFTLPHDIAEGAQTQHGWRYCTQCRSVFYTSDGQPAGECSYGGAHQPQGFDFVLAYEALPEAFEQEDWRFCSKCYSMFWDGDPLQKGVCKAGGGHVAYGFKFFLKHDTELAGAQNQWRFCSKCRTLFWNGDPAKPGICPEGGGHVAQGFDFVLPYNQAAAPNTQNGWRYCFKCRSMFYAGVQGIGGVCPGGGSHQSQGFNFSLRYAPPPPANFQDQWRYCGKCRVMFYDVEGGRGGVCSVD
ncbi:MAG: hypothetical protein J0I19_13225 [Alphaproteobacteria bacterium]|nr:hypothetical protein [Alphaproteobacteria bacterium]